MKLSKKTLIVGLVFMLCLGAVLGCSCSRQVGTLTVSVCAAKDAPEADVAISITNSKSSAQIERIAVNGETASISLDEGEWTVAISTYPKTITGHEVFAHADEQVVTIEVGKTTDCAFTLEFAEGFDPGEAVEKLPTESDQKNSTAGSSASFGSNVGSGSQAAAHEHSWVWKADVSTTEVVDSEAYDEPVYRYATWCTKCNCEVSIDHNEERMLVGDYGHSLTDKEVFDGYIHHDAVTHTETVDNGYYVCSICGETK